MNDERFGVPSASELARLVECPNSHKAQAGLSDDKSKDSSFGDNVHAFLSGDKPWDDLTPQEQQSAEACADAEQWHIDAWKEEGEMTVIRETRLGLTAMHTVVETAKYPNATYQFTGQMDCLVIQEGRGLLIDFKSLHPDIEEPIDNAQMMGNALLVADRYNLEVVKVVIIAPFLPRMPPAVFDERGLQMARIWLTGLLEKEKASTEADRAPGKWCKHCKARFDCAALTDGALESTEIINPITLPGGHPDQFLEVKNRFTRLDAGKFANFLERQMPALKVFMAAMEEAKEWRAANDPEFQKFYVVQESPGNREVECAQKAYGLLAPEGVTQEQVLACCKPSVTGLDEALRVASGVKSVTAKGAVKYNLTAREAKEKLEQILAPVMTRGKNKTKIVKVNQIEE